MTGAERFSGRVESALPSEHFRGDIRVDSANDSRSKRTEGNKRRYVTAARVESLRRRLRPADILLLEDLAQLNAVTGLQLRRLHYADTDTGRRMARLDAKRLVDHGLIVPLPRRIGGVRAGSDGLVFRLSAAGKRLSRSDTKARVRQPWAPTAATLAHALEVTELYVRLIEGGRTVEPSVEQFVAEPRCWRSFTGPGGARLMLKPDAFLTVSTAAYLDAWFIEIDRSTESGTRIKEKLRTYAAYFRSGREQTEFGLFPLVAFVVPSHERLSQLAALIDHRSPDEQALFRVVVKHDAPNRMLSGQLAEGSS